jgi:hypothetical protein
VKRFSIAAYFAVALFPLTTSLAHGDVTEDQCQPVHQLAKKFGPIKDQGGAGFCYSFSTSDLFSEALGLKPPQTVSAFYFGSQYVAFSREEAARANQLVKVEKSSQPAIPSGGMVGDSIPLPEAGAISRYEDMSGKPLLKREGGFPDMLAAHMIDVGHVCLESEIPSQLSNNHNDPKQIDFFMMQMGENARGEFFNSEIDRLLKSSSCVDSPIAPTLDEVRKIKGDLQDEAALVLKDETEMRCKHPISTAGLEVHLDSFRDRDVPNVRDLSEKRMMSLLDEKRPFVLSYDACSLIQCPADTHKPHASIVMGRQWNRKKNACELQIRNSWGKDCALKIKRPDVSCSKGIWSVDIREIADKPSNVTWIEKAVPTR